MKFPTYEKYKPSGVDWIGEVPTHWITWKVTHGFGLVGSGTTPKSNNPFYYGGEIPWITTSELRENIITGTKQKVTEEALKSYSSLKFYNAGAMAIAMYGATIGRLGIFGINATVNQACCVFDKPEQFDIKFFFYWLWMRRPVLISLSVGGGQPNLSQDDLKQLRVPAPPILEQTQIARFLDHKTAQIDQLIAKKKELITKLNEQRIAIITQAVTKGLNPDAPMRDSKVAWLGDIPSHWGTRRLKLCSQENLKYGANEAAELDDRDLPRYIRITDVKEDGSLYDETFRSLKEDIAEPYLLEEGDILLARSGATVGKSFQYDSSWGIAAYAGYLIRFRTDATIIDATFAYMFCRSQAYWANINSTLIQSTIQNFSAEKYGNIVLPLPPLDEQQEIVCYLNKQLEHIKEMEKKANIIVETLQEYRISLITSAVTGKIDVRDIDVPEVAQ